MQGAETEAVRAVEERVRSYHEGAPVATVRGELEKAADEAGVVVTPAWLDDTAQEISDADPLQDGPGPAHP